MDQSWNSSIWQDVTNQNLPQLDGTSDEKQGTFRAKSYMQQMFAFEYESGVNSIYIMGLEKLVTLTELQIWKPVSGNIFWKLRPGKQGKVSESIFDRKVRKNTGKFMKLFLQRS